MTEQPPNAAQPIPAPEDDRWHVQLLGDVAVCRFGEALDGWATKKSQLLLGALAVNIGRQLPRDELKELFWPEASDGAIREDLSRLKKVLTTRPHGISRGPGAAGEAARRKAKADEPSDHRRRHAALRADRFVVDVARFEEAVAAARASDDPKRYAEHAEHALHHYRGPFMPGFGAGPHGAHWIDEQRSRLERMAFELLRRLVDVYERADAYTPMLKAAARARDLAPDREWPYRALMRAHAARGDRDEAIAVFDALERTMREEGLVLSAEAETLAAEIRAGVARRVEQREPFAITGRPPAKATPPSGIVALLAAVVKERPPASAVGTDQPPVDLDRAAALLGSSLERQASNLQGTVLPRSLGEPLTLALHFPVDAMLTAVASAQTMAVMNETPDWAMGIHVGSLDSTGGEETAPPSVAQAAILASIGAPGQILVSDLARALAEPSLPLDLWFDTAGRVALADDRPPEPVFTLRSKATRFVPYPVIGKPSAPTTPPRPGDPFFGREGELAEIQSAFVEQKERLITLHGPGGIGKTRLAIQAADAVAPALDLAPRWVDLSAIEEGQGVALAIVEALGAPLDGPQDMNEATLQRLRDTPTMLLIDNAEQVVGAVAEVVNALLQDVPSLRVLVTSRRLLRLSAENAHEIGPLPVAEASPGKGSASPESDPEAPTPDRATEEAALDAAEALFVDRARAAWRNFDAAANAEEISVLCRLLEGIPLAIELAAALAGVLDPSQMIKLLEDRFRLLDTTRGSLPKRRGIPERHRSLRAAIDASWELLSPEARTLFAQAAIFRGGFTLEALAAVSDLPDVFEPVAELRDAAMLRAAHGGPMLRYRTFETLREYGLERLRSSTSPGEVEAIHERHARYYLQLSEEALPEFSPGPTQSLWLRYFDDERENVRVALQWLEGQGGREDTREPVSLGLRMSGALWRYWFERGRLREGRDFIERFLTMAEPEDQSAEHALALHAAGTLSDYLGDPSGALRLLEASLAIRRARIARFGDAFDDPRRLAYTINNLGNVAQHAGEYYKSITYLEESIALKRAAGDVTRLYSSLENLAGICMVLGDESGMEDALEEVLEIAEELDQDRVVARVHHLRATDRVHRGDHSGARTLFDTASRILGEHARQVFEAPEHLKNRGLEAHWAGRFDEAAHLYDEGLALARELQNRNAESAILRFRGELALDRGRLDEAEALLREALSFARGDAMRLAASGAQYVLARTLVRRGDLAQAHPLLERSLRFRATLAAPLMLAEALEAWSEYLAVQGERNLARRTAGAADRLRREFGYPRPAHQAAAQAATLADAGVAPIDADDPPPEDTQWRGVVTVLLAP